MFTLDEATSRALARPRLLAVLLGAFGVLGLAQGAVGVYGLLAALVNERRREIGVRLALGARPVDVLAMIVRRGLGLAALGVGVGLVGAAGLAGLLRAVRYGVEPVDVGTFVAMAGILLAAAAVASWLPARRAAALDPLDTLRAE